MADINLVPVEEKAQERLELVQRRLQYASIGLLVFAAVTTVATLIFYTTSVSAKNNLIGQITDNTGRINQYKSQEELLVVSKDKAAAADSLLASRTDFNNFPIFKM